MRVKDQEGKGECGVLEDEVIEERVREVWREVEKNKRRGREVRRSLTPHSQCCIVSTVACRKGTVSV